MGDPMEEFCPRCGAERVGAFRFCRGCGLDYDSLPTESTGQPTTARLGVTGRRLTRRKSVVAGFAVVFGLAAIGSVSQAAPATSPPIAQALISTPPPTSTTIPTPTRTPAVTLAPTPTVTPEPTFGPTGPTQEAEVVQIVDGDTIVVAIEGTEYKLRYIGMDTPETVDPASPVEWLGPQAAAANEDLVGGQTVVLEKDVSETDRYGRLLRYVWLTNGVTWTLVNLELVKLGVASAVSYPPDVKYDDVYQAAEAEAQTRILGIWGPVPTPRPTPKPTPRPTPRPTPKPTKKPSSCHPSYSPCLPIVGDLNCPDVRAMGKAPVTVIGPDDYALDRDNDGIGCE